MKTLSLIGALICAANIYADPVAAPFADKNPVTKSANTVVTEPSMLTELEGLGQTLFAAHAASLAIYPSYDPYITVGGVKHPYGWGAALLYPVSEYAFAGLRIDFLGNNYWAPSAVAGAKYTLKNIPLTPTVFTITGILLPVSGAGNQNTVAEAVAGLGVTAVLWHDKSGNFAINAFIEGEKITNFEGVVLHPGIAGAVKF